jgi:hypothetical protein
MESANAAMAGYPKASNIEMDPHEDLNLGGLFGWVMDLALIRTGLAKMQPWRATRSTSWI